MMTLRPLRGCRGEELLRVDSHENVAAQLHRTAPEAPETSYHRPFFGLQEQFPDALNHSDLVLLLSTARVGDCVRAQQSIRADAQQAVWHCLASVQELHAPPYCACGLIRRIWADHHVAKQHPPQALSLIHI